MAPVRLESERAFEAQLTRHAAVPDDMATDPEAFGPWLEELALSRPLPFDGPSMGKLGLETGYDHDLDQASRQCPSAW